MLFTPKIQKAVIRSAILHQNQNRKGTPIPYIIHPYSVALILSDYIDDEDIIVAGLLHDILEDVPNYSGDDMKKEFGEKVYKIVKEVSEDKDPNNKGENKKITWQKRKEDFLAILKNNSFEAMMVCCADKIHNLLSLIEDYKEQGDDLWSKFNAPNDKKMWFYEEILNILKDRLNNDIVKELDRIYSEAKKLF